MQFVKLYNPWARHFEFRVEKSSHEFVFQNGSTMQCSRSRDSSKTNYYMYADTLIPCSISFPPPPPPILVTFYKQVSVFFVLVEYKDGEVGGNVKNRMVLRVRSRWHWARRRTNLFCAVFLEIKVTGNRRLEINKGLNQQTGKLRSKLS
jgi:hypothetical protein